jgi:hypothetical protein
LNGQYNSFVERKGWSEPTEKFLKDEHMKEGKYNCEVSEMI